MKQLVLPELPLRLTTYDMEEIPDYPYWAYSESSWHRRRDTFYMTKFRGELIGLNIFTAPPPHSTEYRVAASKLDREGFYYQGWPNCLMDVSYPDEESAEGGLQWMMDNPELLLVIGALS